MSGDHHHHHDDHDHDHDHHHHGSVTHSICRQIPPAREGDGNAVTQKGLVDPAALDALIDAYQNRVGTAERRKSRRARLERSLNSARR